ncbi:MAG: HPP family protein [Gemmatimonadetes bacterium]|nr:HPP family protein [Gemmatimonadota bacterium]
MADDLRSLKPVEGAERGPRRRFGVPEELVLAMLPTATVLIVLAFVEMVTRQRLLFASLASSAFLIYLDPQHGTNSVRTLLISQMTAAVLGLGVFLLFGPGYLASGIAMVATIVLMIVLDAVHPPAVSTSLSFALRAGDAGNLALFGLALGVTALLVVLQRSATWMIARFEARRR